MRHFKYMRFVSHLSRFVSSDPCKSSVTTMGSHEICLTLWSGKFHFSTGCIRTSDSEDEIFA